MRIFFAIIIAFTILSPAANSAVTAMPIMMEHGKVEMPATHDCCDEDKASTQANTQQSCDSDRSCQHCAQHCFSTSTGLLSAVQNWQPPIHERALTSFKNLPITRSETRFKPPMHG